MVLAPLHGVESFVALHIPGASPGARREVDLELARLCDDAALDVSERLRAVVELPEARRPERRFVPGLEPVAFEAAARLARIGLRGHQSIEEIASEGAVLRREADAA